MSYNDDKLSNIFLSSFSFSKMVMDIVIFLSVMNGMSMLFVISSWRRARGGVYLRLFRRAGAACALARAPATCHVAPAMPPGVRRYRARQQQQNTAHFLLLPPHNSTNAMTAARSMAAYM